jgi:hypothetical protein
MGKYDDVAEGQNWKSTGCHDAYMGGGLP